MYDPSVTAKSEPSEMASATQSKPPEILSFSQSQVHPQFLNTLTKVEGTGAGRAEVAVEAILKPDELGLTEHNSPLSSTGTSRTAISNLFAPEPGR